MGKKIINQYDVRKYEPAPGEVKSYEEVDNMGLGITKDEYNTYLDSMRLYMGKGKKAFGSIFETADFFIKISRAVYIPLKVSPLKRKK